MALGAPQKATRAAPCRRATPRRTAAAPGRLPSRPARRRARLPRRRARPPRFSASPGPPRTARRSGTWSSISLPLDRLRGTNPLRTPCRPPPRPPHGRPALPPRSANPGRHRCHSLPRSRPHRSHSGRRGAARDAAGKARFGSPHSPWNEPDPRRPKRQPSRGTSIIREAHRCRARPRGPLRPVERGRPRRAARSGAALRRPSFTSRSTASKWRLARRRARRRRPGARGSSRASRSRSSCRGPPRPRQ